MNLNLLSNEVFGFLKTSVDAHSLGIFTIASVLRDCGYPVFIAPSEVCEAATYLNRLGNFEIVKRWLNENRINRLGFSYRLDPQDGRDYFCRLYYRLRDAEAFVGNGGTLRGVSFAGLPDACELVKRELGQDFLVFPGDETPVESLVKYGVPSSKFPKELVNDSEYDSNRWEFAKELIERKEYLLFKKQTADFREKLLGKDSFDGLYPSYGKESDSFVERADCWRKKYALPVVRAHAGPYNPNREEALREFESWIVELRDANLLDVLSIGSSQLSQSKFGEDWTGLANGGGVPINSELEYARIRKLARPMLVRTYAGTKNIPSLAEIYEKNLNISWHALSFWWFCKLDGRGDYELLQNLKEQFETVRYIASTNKPLEPIVPHHFAFRGCDDVTYVVSGYLAAKASKKLGVRYLIQQNMLNTPKHTWGVQDLAKGRVLLKLVRELEDGNFKVYLQSRAGLDYFSPDLEKAKIQLAAVTALMDDVEPLDAGSPDIVHVVSYSEAARLATPKVINESIKITLSALQEYRRLRLCGKVPNMAYDANVLERTNELYAEAKDAILYLEKRFPDLYTPQRFYQLFKDGFFPVPYLIDDAQEFSKAKAYATAIKNGGIRVVDDNGRVVSTVKRYESLG